MKNSQAGLRETPADLLQKMFELMGWWGRVLHVDETCCEVRFGDSVPLEANRTVKAYCDLLASTAIEV